MGLVDLPGGEFVEQAEDGGAEGNVVVGLLVIRLGHPGLFLVVLGQLDAQQQVLQVSPTRADDEADEIGEVGGGDAQRGKVGGLDGVLDGFDESQDPLRPNELMRSFIELTRLKVREIDPEAEAKAKALAEAPAVAKPAAPKPTKPKLSEEEETALLHTSQIQALIRRSKLPALLSYLNTNKVSPDFVFQPPEQNHHAPTPLHLASSQNSAPVVLGLIVRGGADPSYRNEQGKAAFEIAGDRATRDAFRVARSELGEDRWDWDAAGVPTAMTKVDADKREERDREEREGKEAERRKAEEERLKVEGPVVKARKGTPLGLDGRGPMKSAEERRQEETRGLTPEMRMRLDRERRARAAEERLKRMQQG
ncbi:hypothetical protein BN1723_014074 [Verticillium longisporum]|uniref:Uncharacterized protein n=1 Tax=Verticillium longisporum TaxID=100787 RepID=A0A0G4M130_VERLO|nr:hypothetical protein BN1723_014074 [Verticillium longisporum]